MARVAGVSRCFIFEVVDGAQQLVGASGATQQQMEAVRRGLEGPLGEIGPELQRIADAQRPGLIAQNDVLSQEVFGGECEMVSALVVPLSYGGRVTGLAYLDEPARRSSFNENQLAALDALTDIAAVGAHSAQIQRRVAERVAMQRHQDRLSAVHHIINQVRIHLEEAELLGLLPRLISDGLGYDRVYIYLIDDDEFTFAGGYFRRHEKECERFEACARGHPPRTGEPSIEVEVYRRGIAQVVAEPSADPRVIRQHQKLLRSPSAAFVPLWGTQSVLGVLFADYKYQEMAVSDEDTSLLSVLATGIGTALENVRLYAEARSDRDKLSTLLANSDDAIIIVDRDRNIVAFNKASERLSGVTATDAVGSNCQEVWRCCDERGRVLGEQSCPVAARIAGLRRDQATYTEHTIRTNDGREVEVASTFAYVEGPDGTVEQGMEILRDLTEHKRWLRERHIADTLQKALLPVVAQADLGIEVGVHYESATIQAAVGGDFYDFIKLDDGRVGIAIGDVCGKGIDAAHHATMTKFTLRAYLLEGASPAALMSRLNDAVAAQLHPGEFISMCFGLLDPVSGSFTYANAGHPRPLLGQEGKGWRSLDRSGIVLGVVPNQSYEEETVELGPEDTLLFYTDGLVETRRGPTCFGEERLMQFLSRCRVTGAQQFAERVHQRSAKFSGGHLLDDVAVVVVRL
jgi:PAS domain S-box-containing protein